MSYMYSYMTCMSTSILVPTELNTDKTAINWWFWSFQTNVCVGNTMIKLYSGLAQQATKACAKIGGLGRGKGYNIQANSDLTFSSFYYLDLRWILSML